MSFEQPDTLDMSTPAAKRQAYAMLRAQTEALLHGERDWLANLAQFAALVYGSVPALNWAGFYMARDNNELVLGPFQGHIACDSASRSELVVPLTVDGRLVAVFDLDSPEPARFDAGDARGIADAVAVLARATDWS